MEIKDFNPANDKEYHAISALSQSGIKDFKKSPFLFWKHTPLNPNYEPKVATDAMVRGTLRHTVILEPEKFDQEFIILDWGTKSRVSAGYRNKVKELEEKGDFRKIVNQEEYDDALEAKEWVFKNPLAKKLINASKVEKPLMWRDKSGLLCKGKPDLLCKSPDHNIYTDYKSTGEFKKSPNPETEGWLNQGVAYRRGMMEMYGIEIHEINFIYQSTKDPQMCKVFKLKDYELDNAEIEYDKNVKEIASMLQDILKNKKDPAEVFIHTRQEKPTLVSAGRRYNSYWEFYGVWIEENPDGTNEEFEEAWENKLNPTI